MLGATRRWRGTRPDHFAQLRNERFGVCLDIARRTALRAGKGAECRPGGETRRAAEHADDPTDRASLSGTRGRDLVSLVDVQVVPGEDARTRRRPSRWHATIPTFSGHDASTVRALAAA